MNQSKKIFARKPGTAGLFLFVSVLHRGPRSKFLRIGVSAGPISEGGLANSPWPLRIDPAALKTDDRGRATTAPQGYPVPMSKKKRVCVVTYQHSGDKLFENSCPPRSNVNKL
jgi:hypothetical protein